MSESERQLKLHALSLRRQLADRMIEVRASKAEAREAAETVRTYADECHRVRREILASRKSDDPGIGLATARSLSANLSRLERQRTGAEGMEARLRSLSLAHIAQGALLQRREEAVHQVLQDRVMEMRDRDEQCETDEVVEAVVGARYREGVAVDSVQESVSQEECGWVAALREETAVNQSDTGKWYSARGEVLHAKDSSGNVRGREESHRIYSARSDHEITSWRRLSEAGASLQYRDSMSGSVDIQMLSVGGSAVRIVATPTSARGHGLLWADRERIISILESQGIAVSELVIRVPRSLQKGRGK